MTHEQEIQRYINQEGLNIHYRHGIAKNIFGTEYTVNIEEPEHCLDISYTRYGTKEITIKPLCDAYTSDSTHVMSQLLAHELGHSETYGINAAVMTGIAVIGVAKAIRDRSTRPLKLTVVAMLACKLTVDELCAETAASVFHGTHWMDYSGPQVERPPVDLYKTLLDLL